MRTHERKKVLMECEAMEAREIEVFILKTLDDHPLAANNPVAIIAGLSNALLTETSWLAKTRSLCLVKAL